MSRLSRHHQPLRVGAHPTDRLPNNAIAPRSSSATTRTTSSSTVRCFIRRRAHRPRAAGPPLQRGHAPGHRGPRSRCDQDENQTLATITLQNFFRLYKSCPDDRTAMTERPSRQIYKLGGGRSPTNKPMVRRTSPTWLQDESAKWDASSRTSNERFEKAQPVLVGTVSVRSPSTCPGLLKRRGVPHECSTRSSTRGRRGGGRGRPPGCDHRRDQHGRPRHRHLCSAATSSSGARRARAPWPDRRGEPRRSNEAAGRARCRGHRGRRRRARRVTKLGGLTCWAPSGTSRAAIDNQLRGRSGRQGDPRESRFYPPSAMT